MMTPSKWEDTSQFHHPSHTSGKSSWSSGIDGFCWSSRMESRPWSDSREWQSRTPWTLSSGEQRRQMRNKNLSDNLQYLHQLVVLVGGQISAGLLLLAGDDDGDPGFFLAAHLVWSNYYESRQGTMHCWGQSTLRQEGLGVTGSTQSLIPCRSKSNSERFRLVTIYLKTFNCWH